MRRFHASVFCLAVSIAIFTSGQTYPSFQKLTDPVQTTDSRQGLGKETEELWHRYQKINPDLKAVLVFDSGLLSLPVVQAADNKTYLRRAFNGAYDQRGTPFLDCHDHLDDQAFLIYGHLVYDDPAAMFSPLLRLERQEEYEQNHSFKLITADEIRPYEISAVFRVLIRPTVFDQRKSSFHDQKDFTEWMDYVLANNEIHSGRRPSLASSFCLLQTCVKGNRDERLIILAERTYE